MDRIRHRCPFCHSINIYKRSWSKVWERKSKMKRFRDEKAIEQLKKMAKKYKCYDCKNEFDVPVDF